MVTTRDWGQTSQVNISDIMCIQEPILEYSKPAYWRNLVTKTFPII